MNSFKACREKKGYTQKEVAFALKISVQAISYWETGERMPSYEKLFQLADLYETTTDELLGRFAVSNSDSSTIKFIHDEIQLVLEYRKLSDDNKHNIQNNILFLLNQQNEEKDKINTTIA